MKDKLIIIVGILLMFLFIFGDLIPGILQDVQSPTSTKSDSIEQETKIQKGETFSKPSSDSAAEKPMPKNKAGDKNSIPEVDAEQGSTPEDIQGADK